MRRPKPRWRQNGQGSGHGWDHCRFRPSLRDLEGFLDREPTFEKMGYYRSSLRDFADNAAMTIAVFIFPFDNSSNDAKLKECLEPYGSEPDGLCHQPASARRLFRRGFLRRRKLQGGKLFDIPRPPGWGCNWIPLSVSPGGPTPGLGHGLGYMRSSKSLFHRVVRTFPPAPVGSVNPLYRSIISLACHSFTIICAVEIIKLPRNP